MKITFIKFYLTLLLIVYGMSSSLALGNGATFGGSGQVVYPLNSNDIELSSEQIYITMDRLTLNVDCYFHLTNFGSAQEVQIGFPDNRSIFGEDIQSITVRDLNTGEQPGVTRKDAKEYEKVYVWKTTFKSGETKPLNVKYTFGFSEASGDPYLSFGYILRTGAQWKGVIKKADFYIIFDKEIPHPCILAKPHDYLYTKKGLEWHYSNLEPGFDLGISILRSWENEKITSTMYLPYQADKDEDYWWDKTFYVAREFAPGEPHKSNPEYVQWAQRKIEEVAEIRNEIYARHGYVFKDPRWKAFFSKKNWYKPNPNFSNIMFNNIENRNILYLSWFEKKLTNTISN